MSWNEMVDQNVTPEERLLRLIESGERGELKPKTAQRSVFWNVRTWSKNLFARRNKTNGSSWVRSAAGLSPELNLRLIIRALIVFLILVFGGIAFNMTRVRTIPKYLTDRAVEPSPAAGNVAGVKKELAAFRPLLDYLKEVEERDIFTAAPAPRPIKPEPKAIPLQPLKPLPPPQTNALQVLREKIKTLKLVGISWGEDPVAMIEDTTKKETNFLKAGQSINEILVKTILRDKVVLSYKDAEYEIF